VAVAQQAVAQATISSPIPGTVVAVNVAPGQSVSAGSTSANVIVEGAGGFEVSTSIGIDSIPRVKVGQNAQVTPDGARRARVARVSSIGVAPDPSSTATRYVVFLALENPNAKLNNGSTATVSIVTGDAKGGLAVPTSAVTTNGSRHTVEVLRGGTPTTKRIRIGVSGPIWTEVRSGLRRGDEVVVADLSEPLPSSATSSTNGDQNQTTTVNGPAFPGRFAGGFNRNG
jgi:HlyD family secretion protein